MNCDKLMVNLPIKIKTHNLRFLAEPIRFLCCLFLSLSLLMVFSSQARSLPEEVKAPEARPKILVLDAYQRGLPIPESINRGILAILKENGFSVADVFIENLDLARLPSNAQRADIVNLLRHKLADQWVGIVITIGALAADFMAREGKDLFPDATVLALISPNVKNLSPAYDRVINIPWRVDPGGTLEIALDLFPDTRQVFVVSGANDRILPFLDEAQKAFGPWKGKLDFEYSNKMTYEEMLRQVASLPKNTIVIYSTFFSDTTGRSFVPAEVVVTVCKAANRPVFATLEEYLGSGIVGGSLLRTEDIGKKAAQIALDYLNGQLELTESVTTFATSPRVAFDWRELRRWKIDHLPRPKNSILINRSQTLWGQYKIQVIATLISILFLTALLIALWLANRRLQLAKNEAIEREAWFQMLLEKIPVPLIHMRLDGQNVFRNEHFVQLFGYSEDIVPTIDEWWRRAYPDPVYRDQVIQDWEQKVEHAAANNKDIEADEYLITCHGGEQRVIEVSGIVLENAILITFIDLTEKKRAHEAVAKGRAEFAAIFNSISDGIVFVDPERRIVRINSAFTRMFGYQLEEIAGQTTQLIYADPEQYSRRGQTRFNPEAKIDRPTIENEYRRKDGSTFPGETIGVHVVDETGKLLGYIGVIHDVSERKQAELKREKLEADLRQAHKMEAIGTMAGGIAHNFNNVLAIILGNLELAKLKRDEKSQEAKHLENASTATIKAIDLVRKIMAYSRQDDRTLAPVRIAAVVDETIQLMRSTIPVSVKFQYQVPSESLDITINADANRIQEALINLCTNAVHAMDEQGTLTISVDPSELKKNDIPPQFECRPGRYARLRVQDTGCGMTAETLEKIFDPFFTTKAVDKGTGIGLSTVQGIVEQHGGLIKVHSGPGQGTTLELFFPLSDHAPVKTFNEKNDAPKGTEKVLYIDDEEMLAQTTSMMLSEMGYRVSVETNSIQALERVKKDPKHFDLVITDQTMPHLTGKELAQEINKINPELPVILCTGYSTKVSEENAAAHGINAFLMKPLEMQKLLQVIRDVLDEKSQTQL